MPKIISYRVKAFDVFKCMRCINELNCVRDLRQTPLYLSFALLRRHTIDRRQDHKTKLFKYFFSRDGERKCVNKTHKNKWGTNCWRLSVAIWSFSFDFESNKREWIRSDAACYCFVPFQILHCLLSFKEKAFRNPKFKNLRNRIRFSFCPTRKMDLCPSVIHKCKCDT